MERKHGREEGESTPSDNFDDIGECGMMTFPKTSTNEQTGIYPSRMTSILTLVFARMFKCGAGDGR